MIYELTTTHETFPCDRKEKCVEKLKIELT